MYIKFEHIHELSGLEAKERNRRVSEIISNEPSQLLGLLLYPGTIFCMSLFLCLMGRSILLNIGVSEIIASISGISLGLLPVLVYRLYMANVYLPRKLSQKEAK